jgi:hypothetical protein
MKKFFYLLFVLLLFSIGANAQNITLDEAYASWKNFAAPSRSGPIQFCLASWIKKGDDEKKVSIEFIAYGKISEFSLKLTPLYIERNNDREVLKQIAAGDTAIAHQTSQSSGSRTEITVVLPIEPNANSIKIEWNFVSNGKKYSHSHTVSMEDDPAIHFLGVTK